MTSNDTMSSTGTETSTSQHHPDKETSILTLPDGRQLAYAQYGSPTGHAILYQHGLPGSRLEASGYHALALELNARVIAIDRPGMGLSSPHPTRTLRDWAKDVQHLTEHLNLSAYSVLGVSGGGPYALSCAAFLPQDKLKCVCIVCGLGPPDIGMKGANILHWLGFTYGWRYAPVWMLRWFFRRDVFGRMELSDEERLQTLMAPKTLEARSNPKDREFFGDEEFLRISLKATREAYKQGFKWIAMDGRVVCCEWGFGVEDIRRDLKVMLWYGKEDTFVPLNHGVKIAERLGTQVEFRVEEETHVSISQRWKREQLQGMLEVLRSG